MYVKKFPQSPRQGSPPPLHVPQQGPYGERCSVSRAGGLLIHLYLSESPKRSLPTKMGKTHTVTVHGASRGQKAYIRPGSHADRLRLCSHYTTVVQHSARYPPPWLGYTRALLASIVSTLIWVYRIPSTTVTASHVTQSTNPRNLVVRTRG